MSNMRINWFQTMKGHTTFFFGQVSTLGLCFGFKSVIDVTLSICLAYDFRNRWQHANNTLSISNMCMYYFYTTKGHTMFWFGRVGTLGLWFGFKSVIDVTLSAQVNTGVTHKSKTKFARYFLHPNYFILTQ